MANNIHGYFLFYANKYNDIPRRTSGYPQTNSGEREEKKSYGATAANFTYMP